MTTGSDGFAAVVGGPAHHIPVLGRPAVDFLNVRNGGVYIDATFGAGGYTRAILERSGEIPLALGEGLQLVARVDDARRPLDARCSYRVGSRAPAARYWTLSLVDREGFPVENAAGRYGFRSSEILRDGDGGFSIFVSASARGGNWLPIGAPDPFALVLRLYDSPLSATAGGIEKSAAPSIVREGCA